MGELLLNPNFRIEDLDPKHHGILMDWQDLIRGHWEALTRATSKQEEMREKQYLFDLFWNPIDSPFDDVAQEAGAMSLLSAMASVKNGPGDLNEDGELFDRTKAASYLAHDLGMDPSFYLLPDEKRYPCINQLSVRLAMDKVGRVEKDKVKEYAKNLNRRYQELGCNFAISTSHPFAQYADKNVQKNMATVLMEMGPVQETVDTVEDNGVSLAPTDRTVQPWYKRLDVEHGLAHNVLDDKELGPNVKPMQKPEYTEHQSLL